MDEYLRVEDIRELLKGTSLGLWVDTAPEVVLTREFFDWYGEDLRFDLLALMVDEPDKDPTLSWSEAEVSKCLELSDKGSIEIVLTSWPYPDKRQIDELCSRLRKLMVLGPVAAIENDLEWNWLSKNLNKQHFGDMDEAGDYLFEAMASVCQEQDARYEVTTHAYHPENSKKADVSTMAARMLSQAYSVASRKEDGETKVIPFSHKTLGPGSMQRFTLDRAREIPQIEKPGGPDLCVGLAAWNQRFGGISHDMDEVRRDLGYTVPVFSMLVALVASLEYHPLDIRWWSLKHILGPRANPYAATFLDLLRDPM